MAGYETNYAITRRLEGMTQEQATARVRQTLADEGFGVLTEIDVQATLKKKLGVDRPPYLILGACNPTFAHQALEAEPAIGVLLPCNVDVFTGSDGATWVQAIRPTTVFGVVNNAKVQPIATEVEARLTRALEKI